LTGEEKLKSSFERTGFWDNVVARKRDGKFEQAKH